MNTLAAQQGRPITALSIIGDWIYSGFGDWNANSDHTAVVRHHLETGEEEILFERDGTFETGLYTEAVESVYGFDGALYVPHIDGLGYWEGCGYATDEGGEWHNVRLPGQALHVFDMAQTPSGTWACGSRITPDQSTGVAAVWFRPAGGGEDGWVHHWDDPVTGDFSRYYHMRIEGDSVVVSRGPGRPAYVVTAEGSTVSDQPLGPPTSLATRAETESHIYTAGVAGEIIRRPNG